MYIFSRLFFFLEGRSAVFDSIEPYPILINYYFSSFPGYLSHVLLDLTMQKLLLSAAAVTLPFFGYEHATSISSPSADPTYLTTEIWMPSPSGANVCSGKSTGHGAIQYGVCGQNNATSSEMISCPDVKHCVHSQFSSADCTGSPVAKVNIDTTGSCAPMIPSPDAPPVYGKFKQVSGIANAIADLSAPVLGMWSGSSCSGGAYAYQGDGGCRGAEGGPFSFEMQCMGENIQSCQWSNSSTCTGAHKCAPTGTVSGTCSPVSIQKNKFLFL